MKLECVWLYLSLRRSWGINGSRRGEYKGKEKERKEKGKRGKGRKKII